MARLTSVGNDETQTTISPKLDIRSTADTPSGACSTKLNIRGGPKKFSDRSSSSTNSSSNESKEDEVQHMEVEGVRDATDADLEVENMEVEESKVPSAVIKVGDTTF